MSEEIETELKETEESRWSLDERMFMWLLSLIV